MPHASLQCRRFSGRSWAPAIRIYGDHIITVLTQLHSVTKQPFINLTVQWARQINDEMIIVRLHGELEVITVTKQKSCSYESILFKLNNDR